jgi:hypothetical protein
LFRENHPTYSSNDADGDLSKYYKCRSCGM